MDCTNIIITVISILLSGLFSWIASWAYYNKSNRTNALSHVVSQVFILTVAEQPSRDNARKLREIMFRHELKHLKNEERALLEKLYSAYIELSAYNKMELYSIILRDAVYKTIKAKKIETAIQPIENSDKIALYSEPIEYHKIHHGIYRFLSENQIDFSLLDEKECIEYQSWLNDYLNETLQKILNYDNNVNFFENESLFDIINNSKLFLWHTEQEKEYYELVDDFEKTFEKEINPLWHEFILENEGYPFEILKRKNYEISV
ncbi:MAG: hypothetical protein IKF64_00250 [Eubacterium sp.]|nr:hypothetical protein [Eubacterium sp.]